MFSIACAQVPSGGRFLSDCDGEIPELSVSINDERFIAQDAQAGSLGRIRFMSDEMKKNGLKEHPLIPANPGPIREPLNNTELQLAASEPAAGDGMEQVRAVLTLAHRNEEQAYVRDMAAVAKQIFMDQGESLKISIERVGHVLKGLGLFTRRLGSGGRGLILDKLIRVLVHRLALEYDVLSSAPECGHCQSIQAPRSEELM
jgi:hypothetical protein